MARASSKKKKRVIRWTLVLILALFILTIRLVEDIGLDKKPSDRFLVVAVVDGDTMELTGGDKLRLLSIDTPEEGEPYYVEAKELLSQLALGRVGRIEFAELRRDRYGRLLGYLYIDSLFVNEAIVDNGLANLYLFRDNDVHRPQTRLLLAAQRRAMDARRGIWSIERQPEEYYIAIDNSFRLHRPGCRSVAKVEEGRYRKFKTREEGLREGLSPCRNCKP